MLSEWLLWYGKKDLNKSSEFVRQLIEQSAKQIDNINECGLLDAENTLKNYEEFEKIFDEEQGKSFQTTGRKSAGTGAF